MCLQVPVSLLSSLNVFIVQLAIDDRIKFLMRVTRPTRESHSFVYESILGGDSLDRWFWGILMRYLFMSDVRIPRGGGVQGGGETLQSSDRVFVAL